MRDRVAPEIEHAFIAGDRVRRTGLMHSKRHEDIYRVVRLDHTGPYVWIVPENPTPTNKNERCVTEAYLELVD